MLATTLLTLCSRDYFSSSYPNTIKFEENILRWRKSNSIFEPSASKLVAFPRLPLRSSQDSIESFISTKGGALWVGNVLIRLSRSSKTEELPIIDLLDFCVIHCEIWPAVWMSKTVAMNPLYNSRLYWWILKSQIWPKSPQFLQYLVVLLLSNSQFLTTYARLFEEWFTSYYIFEPKTRKIEEE